jgi:DNA helicase II / ATP-dependent DNA helicase PcrA
MTIEAAELETSHLEDFLQCKRHALVLGGPGSGKTTGALIKANRETRESGWAPYQQALFLSFARSTVARVAEAAGAIIHKEARSRIEVTTYHSFAWRLVRSHGYLLQSDPPIRLLPPHDAAARLAAATRALNSDEARQQKENEKRRLLTEEGLLVFDYFAELAANLLENSDRIRKIVSRRFPLVFLDEFQDTNEDEYRLIRWVAQDSQVIALADPEQRIYEFRGADPKRIGEFVDDFKPETFDFAERNHRSDGTDILEFANDLLSSTTSKNEYQDVQIKWFPTRRADEQHLWVKGEVIAAKNRMKNANENWSVGLLVPTNRLMLAVSDFLLGQQSYGTRRLYSVQHEVAVDAEGPALAGVAIGRLMECSKDTCEKATGLLLDDLCRHIGGRKGGRRLSQAESALVEALRAYVNESRVRGQKRQRIVSDCIRITKQVAAAEFTGNPHADWISVRDIIEAAESEEVRAVAWDAKYLRFLRKGTQLRLKLAGLWKSHGSYAGAASAVQNAFIQEHFVAKSQEPRGVHVMTIHKSKGKEFDEVIIYEGIHADRLVREPDTEAVVAQARLFLRVAVSRARKRVTILTPQEKPCELL